MQHLYDDPLRYASTDGPVDRLGLRLLDLIRLSIARLNDMIGLFVGRVPTIYNLACLLGFLRLLFIRLVVNVNRIIQGAFRNDFDSSVQIFKRNIVLRDAFNQGIQNVHDGLKRGLNDEPFLFLETGEVSARVPLEVKLRQLSENNSDD